MWWGQSRAISALFDGIPPPMTIIRGERIRLVPGATSAMDVRSALQRSGLLSPLVSSSTFSSNPFPLSSFAPLVMMNASEMRQGPITSVQSTPHEVIELFLSSFEEMGPLLPPSSFCSQMGYSSSHIPTSPLQASLHHTAANPNSVNQVCFDNVYRLANNIVQDVVEDIDRIIKLDALCSGVCSKSARQGIMRGLETLVTVAGGGAIPPTFKTNLSKTTILFSPVYSPTESLLEALAGLLHAIPTIANRCETLSLEIVNNSLLTQSQCQYTRPHLLWLPSPLCALSSGIISSILIKRVYGKEIRGVIKQPSSAFVDEPVESSSLPIIDFSVVYGGSVLGEAVLNSYALTPLFSERASRDGYKYRVYAQGACDYSMSFLKLLQDKDETQVMCASKLDLNIIPPLPRTDAMRVDVALPSSTQYRSALAFTSSLASPSKLSEQSIKMIASLCAEHAFYRHGGQSPFTARYVYLPKQWVEGVIKELVEGHLKGVTRCAERREDISSPSSSREKDDRGLGHALEPHTSVGPLNIQGEVEATLTALDKFTSYSASTHGDNSSSTRVRTVVGGFSPVMPHGEGKSFICPTVMYVEDKLLLSIKPQSLKELQSTTQTTFNMENERNHPIWTTNVAAPVLFIIPYKMDSIIDEVTKDSTFQPTSSVPTKILENFFFYLTGGHSMDNVPTNRATIMEDISAHDDGAVCTAKDEVYSVGTSADSVGDSGEFIATFLKRKGYGDGR